MQTDTALTRAVAAVNANRAGSVCRPPASTIPKTAALAAAVARTNTGRSTACDLTTSPLAGAVAALNRQRRAAA